MSKDPQITCYPSSKITAALWAAATISHSFLNKAGERTKRCPSSHTFCSECKCLLCRSEAGYGAEHILGALVWVTFYHEREQCAVYSGVRVSNPLTDNNTGLLLIFTQVVSSALTFFQRAGTRPCVWTFWRAKAWIRSTSLAMRPQT